MRKFSKFLTMAFVSMLVFANANAQETAGDVFNKANEAYQAQNLADAVNGYKQALTLAEAEGNTELVDNCKKNIPAILYALGKEQATAKNFDGAVATLKEAIAKANEYGNADVADAAKEFIPLIFITEGNTLLNEKKFAEAVVEYEKALAEDPENGMAHLRIGMCKNQLGDADAAVAAFEKAIAHGQEATAKKQLINVFVKKANADLKAKNMQGALDNAVKSLEYGENANAYNIGGNAAFALKNYDKAIELLSKAKANKGTNYNLARAYEAKGNKAKACEYYKMLVNDATLGEYAKSKVTALCN